MLLPVPGVTAGKAMVPESQKANSQWVECESSLLCLVTTLIQRGRSNR